MKKCIIAILLFFPILISSQHYEELSAENNHSTVGFSISIAGFTRVTGKFTKYDISIDWDDQVYTNSSITAVIDVNSINTGIDQRDEHLRSSDFFNEEAFPTIEFKSDTIQQIDFSHYSAFGKLTLCGITKTIELPFQIVKKDGTTIGFKSRMTINRQDFEIGTNFTHTSIKQFLADEVEVEIDLWTKKRKQTK